MKTWFITGASSGFGRHLTETVLAQGDQVVATARQPEQLADLVANFPDQACAVRLDITRADEIEAALKEAIEAFGRIDVLVNNAGFGLLGALEETNDAQMLRNLETNLLGPLRLIRAALPQLRAQGSGYIISNTAIAAFANEAGFCIYGAAKSGLEAASEALLKELAPFGIKVSLVVPGPFRTEFISRSLEKVPRMPEYARTVGKFEAVLNAINGKQLGDPRKAAEAIYQMAYADKPPFRLVLGRYANEKFQKKLKELSAELAEWEAVGLPTDYF